MLAVVAVVVLGACVQPARPSGELVSVKTDVEFDKTPDKEAATVPANFVDPFSDWAEVSGTQRVPDFFFLPPGLGIGPPDSGGGRSVETDCPAASLSEFPDEETLFNVPDKSRLPREGIYRWRRSGRVEADGKKFEVSGFEERVVRSVKLLSDEARPSDDPGGAPVDRLQYTFEVVQPEVLSKNFVVTTFFVDTNSPAQIAERPAMQRINNGPPERGVVIRKIVRVDRSGKEVGAPFAPPTGVLIAPLPIRQGEQYVGAAADPVSGQTMSYAGQTTRRARVDACGEILEGWLFEGVLTVNGSAQMTRRMNFLISTNLGAIPISEVIDGDTDSGDVNLSFSIGQKDPTPFTAQ